MPDGSVKLGFRAHYPQLETKLTVRGTDLDDVRRKLAPVEAEIRKRLGNFILGEDDQTLEGVVLAELIARRGIARRGRNVHRRPDCRRGSRTCPAPSASSAAAPWCVTWLRLDAALDRRELTQEITEQVADAARRHAGATHALAVLIELDEGADRIDFGGTHPYRHCHRNRHGVPPIAYSRRARLGAAGRRRAGPGLPAPLSPASARRGAHRLREGLNARPHAGIQPIAPAPAAGAAARRAWQKLLPVLEAYAFLLPLLVVLIGLAAYPLIDGVWTSFTNREVAKPGSFIGLANFAALFGEPDLSGSPRSTPCC